ncbi:ribosomal protein L22 [Westerdykella ornata]|uniref:Ribosomal protein L22 n=1 Tax=Westerdykella ornata TaxID=318751 RepID=A0A6A6JGM6_WESOR|nr:ribosomal protein L22 [Westerdykella ornata]KAF2275354.1 ribosomal protein L22 [Westerdykella ornata]
MSARIPTRRIGQHALSTTSLRPSTTHLLSPSSPLPLPLTPTRYLSLKERFARLRSPFKKEKAPPDYSNPILTKYLLDQERLKKQNQIVESEEKRRQRMKPKSGGLNEKTSLFNPRLEVPGWREGMSEEEQKVWDEKVKVERERQDKEKAKRLAAMALDPDPRARALWERRLVIRQVQRRGRVTRDVQLARLERESVYKSIPLRTSVKKLTKIMNMIQGKTVEEALVQLRFNPKKVARDVYKGLQIARDEAIVKRGMGLGGIQPTPELEDPEEVDLEMEPDESQEDFEARVEAAQKAREGKIKAIEEKLLSRGTFVRPKIGPGIEIELKDGRRKRVHDPTEMYIDQAYVGRLQNYYSRSYRARGRVDRLTHRMSTFTVVLKEEKTRMRISDEIKKKRDNRKLWTALPDRPVLAQQQYCLW